MTDYTCPTCGEMCEQLSEGLCEYCHTDEQSMLDAHTAHCERWQTLSDEERRGKIRAALCDEAGVTEAGR